MPHQHQLATVQSASQINLAWPAVSGASYYRLYNNSNEIYGDSNLTYNNTGLSANTSYSYTLSACVSNDINSCSAVSLAVNAITLLNAPSAPTATVQSASQINLSWSAVSGASYYRLYNNSSEIYGDSNLTYNNTGLSANTSYSYTLRACVSNDINSCSAVSQAVNATTQFNIPPVPSAPTATVQSASQINLAWSAVSGANYYRLYNNSSEIYGDSNLTYNNTGLSANTSYSYTLRACVSNDINSCSAVSQAVNATTQFNIPPVPSAPTATVQSASQINLAWSAVSGANYYRLYNNSNEIYGDSNLTYNNTGLSANTSYSYTLRACVSNDINSCSAVSQAVSAITLLNAPSAPTATVQSASQINLAWPAVSGASYYRLYNNSNEIYGDSNLTYNNTGLSANTSYSYTLRACVSNDINSCSAVSQAVSAITLLNAPSAPTATVQSTSQINLEWPAVLGASDYEVYRATNNISASSTKITNPNPTTESYTDTGLITNTLYYYWLKACSSSCSGYSNVVSARTQSNIQSSNDTGITFGGDYSSGNNSSCTSNISDTSPTILQDCHQGRDAQASTGTLSKVGAGHGGFDFSKLDSNGNTLSSSASSWSCVKDNNTGLVWEVKTNDGTTTIGDTNYNIHHKDNTYRWGGLTAIGRDHSSREGTYYDDWNTLINGSNTESLCGFNNWKVPTINELYSIANLDSKNPANNPAIDTNYFPNTTSLYYWSSSPYATFSSNAWQLHFDYGDDYLDDRDGSGRVRLVRSGE